MKVSVLIVTYNQRPFIVQAIESALMQRTNFDYEIIIGEDCSTDGTREIVKVYADRYPNKIRALFHPHNLGPQGLGFAGKNNFIQTYKASRGHYLAILEGDDYWTDPDKLQRQVDFMDGHPECAVCYHPVDIVYSDGRTQLWPSVMGTSPKEISTIEDLLSSPGQFALPIPSMMFRGGIFKEFPDWFYEVPNGDSAMELLLAHHGDIGFLKERMAVHRKHSGGASRMFEIDPDYCNEMLLKLCLHADRHFNYKYHSLLKKRIAGFWFSKALAHKRKGEYGKASKAFAHYLFTDSTDSASLATRVPNTLRFFLPDFGRRAVRSLFPGSAQTQITATIKR